MKRLKRLAPFMVAGPISGPLLAGVVINLRAGNRVLAAMYAVALAEMTVLLPVIVGKMGLAVLA